MARNTNSFSFWRAGTARRILSTEPIALYFRILEQRKDRLLDALLEGAIDDRAAINAKLNQLNLAINAEEKRK